VNSGSCHHDRPRELDKTSSLYSLRGLDFPGKKNHERHSPAEMDELDDWDEWMFVHDDGSCTELRPVDDELDQQGDEHAVRAPAGVHVSCLRSGCAPGFPLSDLAPVFQRGSVPASAAARLRARRNRWRPLPCFALSQKFSPLRRRIAFFGQQTNRTGAGGACSQRKATLAPSALR
jgi:hypothetical protein